MIDLHIHSIYSDGTYSIDEILLEAQKNNVTTISITDHNTIDAYYDVINKKNTVYKGEVITGVEIDCIAYNYKIELLGYNFKKFDMLKNWLNKYYSSEKRKLFRAKEYTKLLDKMCEVNILNGCNLIYDESDLPHTAVYKNIIKYPSNKSYMTELEWNDFDTFFRNATTNSDSLFFIDYLDMLPSIDEVSDIIRRAGGKIFIAHVYHYKMDHHIQFIMKLVNDHFIDGVEVFHSKFTVDQTKQLIDFCKCKKIFMSGGSDSHGLKGNIKNNIGTGYGNLYVPESILTEWHK
ncbi:MAG: PHP domain-containing protein [Oscillospiraceae bacterium]|jgi:predicted metal-dependent phosphoesterase TrpH|nr:PHP domain-containing protein [Oscillospiraceae bacterium]